MNSVKVTFDLFEERLIHIQNLMRMGYSNKIILSILMVLASVSCGDAGLKKAEDVLIDIKGRLSPPTTVVVQPFEGFPDSDLDYVVKRLKVDFTGSVVVREAVPLPKEAYNRPRSRYYADSLLNFLSRRVGRNEKIVGLTHRDMGKNRDSIPLFGIMGLGNRGGNQCVVSSVRVYKRGRRPDNLYKVVVHELGHTWGLGHCTVKTCYLRDAKGGNPLNEETGFCDECKSYLNKRGWRFP